MRPSAKNCVHCGMTLRKNEGLHAGACDKTGCQRMAQLQAHMRCVRCGRTWVWAQSGSRTCSDAACRQADAREHKQRHVREQQRAEAAELDALRERATTYRNDCASEADIANADSFVVVAVPHNAAQETPLPEPRREKFRQHLIRTLQGTTVQDGRSFESPPKATSNNENVASDGLSFVLGQACASCRGSCCMSAGEKAFIGSRTIERVMQQRPSLSVDEIIPLYLSYVQPRTLEGGCVYQGSLGCTLPADLRSDICDVFFCVPLRALTYEYNKTTTSKGGSAVGAFITATRDTPFEQGKFIIGELVQIVNARERTA